MHNVLFYCANDAYISLLAKSLAQKNHTNDIVFYAGGPELSNPHSPRSTLKKSLISNQNFLVNFDNHEFDVVILIYNIGLDTNHSFKGNPLLFHWNIPEIHNNGLKSTKNHLKENIDKLFKNGYLNTLLNFRHRESIILENVSDAIIIHDLNRKILVFNKAAEKITGYSRHEVINKDCHTVFNGGICGVLCPFKLKKHPKLDRRSKAMIIRTRHGEDKLVKLSFKYILDTIKTDSVVVSFKEAAAEKNPAKRTGDAKRISGIIGTNSRLVEILDFIHDLAKVNVPVLIQGESGTGKELIAEAIHNESPRSRNLFVPVNCGALPESLLETELFGHVKGAFTGAIKDKKGRFELADGGTIFLDEIGDISPAMQVKLLRVLQHKCFERVGSEKTIKIDVRVISATNKNLAEELKQRRFRKDLYYRLNVVPLEVPPLRERKEDIPLLIDNILTEIARENLKPEASITSEALSIMLSHSWPGNIRELQNWIQFAIVKSRGEAIKPEHLPFIKKDPVTQKTRRKKTDINSINREIKATGGNKIKAAKKLGISRASLYRYLKNKSSVSILIFIVLLFL